MAKSQLHQNLTNIPTYLTYDDVLLLPNYSEITPSKTNLATQLTKDIALEMPIVASPMDTVCEERLAREIAKLGGYGIIHRNLTIEDQVTQVKSIVEEGLLVGAAVGVGADFEERVRALVDTAHVAEICLDSAHGHTKHIIEAIKNIKKWYPKISVIAGNVATYQGAKDLFMAGADAVKIGMGPGSICTTRVVSGMGVPQLTAVAEGVRAARECGGYIIADGGIKTSGDIVKALAIGAATVMLGSLLAGTDESPGDVIEVNGKLFKSYRGMGSIAAMKKGSAKRYGQKWHVHQLLGGIRAGMAYLGAATLSELTEKAQFIRITDAGVVESRPHSIVIV
jgi:IMP dehydrogenase